MKLSVCLGKFRNSSQCHTAPIDLGSDLMLFVLVVPHLFDAGFEAYFVFVQQPKGLVLVKALLFVGQCPEINEIMHLSTFKRRKGSIIEAARSRVVAKSWLAGIFVTHKALYILHLSSLSYMFFDLRTNILK